MRLFRVFKILNTESKLTKQERNLAYRLNTKDGEKAVRKIFEDYKPDEEQRELFEKVLPMAQKLEVTFIHALHNGDKSASGLYEAHRNIARLKHNHTNIKEKGATLLHQLIHAVSSRALLAFEKNPSVLNDMQKTAIKNIKAIYKELTEKTEELGFKKEDYGLKNEHELLAELSNREFREKLIDNILRIVLSVKDFVSAKKAMLTRA